MDQPTYHFLRSDDAVYVATKWDHVRVLPAVCDRCNRVEYIALPADVDAVAKYMKLLARKHRRCGFRPVDWNSRDWEQRWKLAFTWIARQALKSCE